jgi:hypothetical protein
MHVLVVIQSPTICLPASQIRRSQRIAAFTGAGISKAAGLLPGNQCGVRQPSRSAWTVRHHLRLHAGVPDFRGPTGIWTLQRAGLPIPKLNIEFGAAKPSITHQVLLQLVAV